MTPYASTASIVVLDRLPNAKPHGAGWTARCPAHEDRDPSLSISQAEDGRVLLHCFAGCSIDAITKALGIDIGDLFPRTGTHSDAERARRGHENHLRQVRRDELKRLEQRTNARLSDLQTFLGHAKAYADYVAAEHPEQAASALRNIAAETASVLQGSP